MKYERILIVADDSPSAIKAVKYGFELARQLGAKVKIGLIDALEPAKTEGNVDAGIFPDDAENTAKKDAEKFLHGLAKDYGKGVETEYFAPEGEVHDVVLQMAREWDAHLIVAGTHGRKGLNRLLEGSIAEGILRDSQVPLFIVPMDK
ncbi:nucleotide-binding universal stress UspA family protein [Arcticibacter tournemirensis]|uniref:Universal stress protein n=1 Tax=Arcticibacter tournemirensis TaxID=699437 RepID=A0A5M9HF14_9SPHI|nr:universal stress protein [Arcticibacter tournemirensis]KAA8485572.1 universal stress protein [Arcticibacter tournemirensis]TQM48712.1 nucleotide-binding universal stress UspA family protein [Arcticibacter tournemirensis]